MDMEPITVISTALTSGVATTGGQAIKDAYAGLKRLIVDRYQVSLSGLENNPESETQKAAVRESLKDVGAYKDPELRQAAQDLLDELNQPTNVSIQAEKSIFSYNGNVKVDRANFS